MPEILSEKYVTQIPKFVLPPELTNKEPEVVKPAEAPKEPEAPPKAEEVAEAATPEKEEKPSEETTEKDPEKQSSRRFERRIDRAHRRAAEAQARAELLERQLAELKAQATPKTVANAPRMEDFTDVQEYAKAYANFEKDQALKDYQAKQQEAQAKAHQEKLNQDWEGQVSKAMQKYEDWDEVVGEIKPTTPWAVAMMRAENGADIAHHLGSHPTEAKTLMQLDPYSQVMEIGRLSVKLSQPPKEAVKAPSSAPRPITPVQPEAKRSGDEIRPDQPYEEYRKVGNKLFGRGRKI